MSVIDAVFLHLDAAMFYLFAALALVSAAYMVTQRNPNYSAFAFVVTLISLSAIYALLAPRSSRCCRSSSTPARSWCCSCSWSCS